MVPPRRRLPDARESSEMTRYLPPEPIEPPHPPHEPSGNLLVSIWRHRWSALLITLFCLAGGFVYLQKAPKYYAGYAMIYVRQDAAPVAIDGQIQQQFISPNYLQTQCTLISSNVILRPVAERLYGHLSDEELTLRADQLAYYLNAEVGRKDDTINVTFEARDPVQAARISNMIVDEYIRHQTETPIDMSKGAARILMEDKHRYDTTLAEQDEAITKFKREHPGVALSTEKGNVAVAALAKFSDALTTAHLALIDAEAAYNQAFANKGDPRKLRQLAASQKYGDPSIDQQLGILQNELNTTEGRLELNTARYGPNSPLIQGDLLAAKKLRSQIDALQKQFTDVYLGSIQTSLLDARDHEKKLRDAFDNAQREATDMDAGESQLARLVAERDGTSRLVTALNDRINQLGIKESYNIPTIDIFRRAQVESQPSRPMRNRVLALVLAIGLLSGCGYGVLRDRLDERVRSADEIAAILGLPVVGAIPHMKRGLTVLARSQAAHWDPMSDVAEAYRAVRTAIHFGVPAGQARTIVVTSPTPGDGKSTLASNLAITMAQAGKRTLLLDADFRRPVQQKMFEVKEPTGLTSVLAGNETLAGVIRRTVVEGLDILPAGPSPLNPSELLHGESFADILEELTRSYDHVVLDCPPVMAVTDSRILGAVCDVTLLVLRAGSSTRRAAELARGSLLSVGARLLGVVVNDVVAGDSQYGYHGTYYSYQPFEYSRRRLADEVDETIAHEGRTNGSRKHRPLPLPSKAK